MENISKCRVPVKSIYTVAVILLVIMISAWQANSQPYIDLVNFRYINSPDIGKVGKNKNPTRLDYFNISTTIPIQFKNKQDALVLSPFLERWSSRVQSISGFSEYHYGLVFPVSFIKTIPRSKWSLLTTAIFRMNDADINRQGQWQFGGALLASKNINKDLTYKLGVYINSDFFGLFIVPLLGIDWRINERTNLFGVLPASLTLEYKLASKFFSGLVFRTFTNSYYDAGPNYIRIDENQLGIFLDYYLTKSVLLNLETGHSILRKIRSGEWHDVHNSWNADDDIYFKFSIAYRFRFRK